MWHGGPFDPPMQNKKSAYLVMYLWLYNLLRGALWTMNRNHWSFLDMFLRGIEKDVDQSFHCIDVAIYKHGGRGGGAGFLPEYQCEHYAHLLVLYSRCRLWRESVWTSVTLASCSRQWTGCWMRPKRDSRRTLQRGNTWWSRMWVDKCCCCHCCCWCCRLMLMLHSNVCHIA